MRILVAMSGGVDSSVAALVLRDQGHEVTGATLRLWGGPSDSGCCSVADVDDARRVAHVLGIDHHVFNYADEFAERVIEPYAAEHARGRTPNPCIECNRHVKFDLLTARARRLGFDAVATGHHARVVERGGRRWLSRISRALRSTIALMDSPGVVRFSGKRVQAPCTRIMRISAAPSRAWRAAPYSGES